MIASSLFLSIVGLTLHHCHSFRRRDNLNGLEVSSSTAYEQSSAPNAIVEKLIDPLTQTKPISMLSVHADFISIVTAMYGSNHLLGGLVSTSALLPPCLVIHSLFIQIIRCCSFGLTIVYLFSAEVCPFKSKLEGRLTPFQGSS